ncbi:MAG: cyclic nucleotide-binding domain-containing protein [Nitrospinaceae bacterium]|nr:cyclic nucleotide-binding domain-containing protein [Nitrospinaceae bacterium]NIR55120.1 cyclic nucleotide-binding domain-containing protein [Nitrospinaceae bacterium]NIS85541.1 cyclic nucleotide-binding domain-containing protein [Nitrospinaceae bacterium]NIT82375.1 cyclic nucleotide-binding domain-containing protein [Nitrospinaceae bacterium]NIU44588.1 cyclic nucleotide-binding domain-containing protein [Nitrospinaceae bacterium]
MPGTQYLKKGQIIFREGSPSDFAFIIEDGQVEVSRKRSDGNVEILDVLGQNDIFGEMGMIDGAPRSATVTALKKSKVSMISRLDLRKLAEKDPKAWLPIVRAMASRLRRSVRRDKQYIRNRALATAK